MSLSSSVQSALSVPSVFELFQRLVGAPALQRRFVDVFARPRPGDRVIDLGCGTGAILEHLPEGISYVGVDISRKYIDAANARFHGRGTFLCSNVLTTDLSQYAPFDLAVSVGVLHHLDEQSARAMVRLAARVVRPDGHLVTLDPCRIPGQSRIAKFLLDRDRGQYIRDADQYRALFASYGAVDTELLSDMLRIPWSMVVARARIAQ